MDPGTQIICHPRRPERDGLKLAVRKNLELFFDTCDERFLDQQGPLTDRARRRLMEYLRCGVCPS